MQRRKLLFSSLTLGARLSAGCAWSCACGSCGRPLLFEALGATTAAIVGSRTREATAAPTPTPAVLPTPTVSPPHISRFRLIRVDRNANPFLGKGDGAEYGGSKHVMWTWHPLKKRVYTWGGDYGVGASKFGQPDMGARFTVQGRTYERNSSLCNDPYSIDPYATTRAVPWRLEHPYVVRTIKGAREMRPGRPDQVSLVWDPVRSKFWGFITVLRTEFLYMNNGVPDLWANGDTTTTAPIEPTGTWSWIPSDAGGAGTWTFETAARVAYRTHPGGTFYENGNVLVTSSGDERIAYWERDSATDRFVAFGLGRIFIFDPSTKTYEHRAFAPSGYSYFNACSSQCAIVGDWMYGVALTQSGTARRSELIRVNVPNMLALANGANIPGTPNYWDVFTLPWSLSDGGVWESKGDASSKWQEHAGVLAIDDKVVIVCSYDHIIDGGIAKMSIFSTVAKQFSSTEPPPENFSATSWVALPDKGEVMFGLSSSGYPNAKLWVYRVR
jgi:hypothetical protein